jgi:hypothetical protein
VNGSFVAERQAGILIIDELIKLKCHEQVKTTMIIRFANSFRILFQVGVITLAYVTSLLALPCYQSLTLACLSSVPSFLYQAPNSDPVVLELAAKALGHLCRTGGALVGGIVEFQVRSALFCCVLLLLSAVVVFCSCLSWLL